MDDEMQAIEIRNPELERRFEAFARLRLSPDPRAIARIRARVMREARLQHDAARIAAYVAPAMDARRRPLFRRAAMPLLAAGLWTEIAVGTIAAAQPGGGLYPARLWVERAALPSVATARVDADLGHLDDRISEALAAAGVGDRGALAASLEAYGVSAEDATTTSAGDLTLVTRVEDALHRHQAVLTALVAGLTTKANETAADAIERNIERAIEHNAAVLAALETRRGDDAANGAGNAGGGASGTAGGAPGTSGGGGSAESGGGTPTSGSGAGASGTTGGGTSGTGGTDAGTTSSGGSAASQNPRGQDAGSGNGAGATEGDSGGSRPSDGPAPSPVAPDHSPHAGG